MLKGPPLTVAHRRCKTRVHAYRYALNRTAPRGLALASQHPIVASPGKRLYSSVSAVETSSQLKDAMVTCRKTVGGPRQLALQQAICQFSRAPNAENAYSRALQRMCGHGEPLAADQHRRPHTEPQQGLSQRRSLEARSGQTWA